MQAPQGLPPGQAPPGVQMPQGPPPGMSQMPGMDPSSLEDARQRAMASMNAPPPNWTGQNLGPRPGGGAQGIMLNGGLDQEQQARMTGAPIQEGGQMNLDPRARMMAYRQAMMGRQGMM